MRKIVVIAGPTASGKTKYAIEAARALGGEIVSCDSMQLYKFMDIGSAKPTAEERALAVYHLVDSVDPSAPFSVAQYCGMAKAAIEEIFEAGRVPVIEGGTGLYLNSLLYDMDFGGTKENPGLRTELTRLAEEEGGEALHRRLESIDGEAASRIHPNNVKRLIRALESAYSGSKIADFTLCDRRTADYGAVLVGITRERSTLYERINRRVDTMVAAGLFDEVQSLLERGLTAKDISMNGIGYKEIIDFYEGLSTREEAIERIKTNSRHLAKRQLTWFRRYKDMKWFDISRYDSEERAGDDIVAYIEGRLRSGH